LAILVQYYITVSFDVSYHNANLIWQEYHELSILAIYALHILLKTLFDKEGSKICPGRNPVREQKGDSRVKFGKETVAGARRRLTGPQHYGAQARSGVLRLLRLYSGSGQALVRLCSGSTQALLRLYSGSIQALLKALLRFCSGSAQASVYNNNAIYCIYCIIAV
jgi:hypothetical protein